MVDDKNRFFVGNCTGQRFFKPICLGCGYVCFVVGKTFRCQGYKVVSLENGMIVINTGFCFDSAEMTKFLKQFRGFVKEGVDAATPGVVITQLGNKF